MNTPEAPWLLVGLGNPGEKYARTRHNAGAWLLDILREQWKLPAFSIEKEFHALVSRGKVSRTNVQGSMSGTGSQKPTAPVPLPAVSVILAFPQTFMNNSGDAVKPLLVFHRIPPDHLIVLHDDKDIPFGETRVQRDRGAAGHKGVQSILAALGTQDFWRVRLGTGVAEQTIPTEAFVLQPFAETAQLALQTTTLPTAQKDIEVLLVRERSRGC